MKITDTIRSWLGRRDNHTLFTYMGGYGMPLTISNHRFGETIYLNAAQILTDLFAELVWLPLADTPKGRAWLDFVNRNGQRITLQLLTGKGYTVIGYEAFVMDGRPEWVFYEMPEDKYQEQTIGNRTEIKCLDDKRQYFVLKSPTYEQTGKSDHWWSDGYIKLLDAVFNGATTTAERLGAYVVMSPKQDNFGGVLPEADKKELEQQITHDYGMLRNQQQMMILPRPMDSQVVSLAGIDSRLKDKATLAILAIADRLKVPANQIGIIDGGQSKSFANGTEYREGDLAKYRSFRRLVNSTWWDFANEIGLKMDYRLENEPKTVQGQTIEN